MGQLFHCSVNRQCAILDLVQEVLDKCLVHSGRNSLKKESFMVLCIQSQSACSIEAIPLIMPNLFAEHNNSGQVLQMELGG